MREKRGEKSGERRPRLAWPACQRGDSARLPAAAWSAKVPGERGRVRKRATERANERMGKEQVDKHGRLGDGRR